MTHADDTKDEMIMTTRTVDRGARTDRTVEADDATAPAESSASAKAVTAKTKKPSSTLRGVWDRRSLTTRGDGLPVVIWSAFFRSVTLIADFLLAFITAMVIIPTLGAWLHQQSGAAHGSLTMAGTIAMWLTPLLFLIIILAAGEIAVMRALWRWGTRRIQNVRDARAGEPDSEAAAVSSRRPATQAHRRRKKNNRTRST